MDVLEGRCEMVIAIRVVRRACSSINHRPGGRRGRRGRAWHMQCLGWHCRRYQHLDTPVGSCRKGITCAYSIPHRMHASTQTLSHPILRHRHTRIAHPRRAVKPRPRASTAARPTLMPLLSLSGATHHRRSSRLFSWSYTYLPSSLTHPPHPRCPLTSTPDSPPPPPSPVAIHLWRTCGLH